MKSGDIISVSRVSLYGGYGRKRVRCTVFGKPRKGKSLATGKPLPFFEVRIRDPKGKLWWYVLPKRKYKSRGAKLPGGEYGR